MIEFLAFSDTHIHEFKAYSEMVDYSHEGSAISSVNNRLRDAARSLYQMLDYASVNGIKFIVFSGDLFHTKASYTKIAVEILCHVFEYAGACGIQIYLTVGNHDFSNRECTVSGLLPFNAFSNVHLLEGSGFTQIKAGLGEHDWLNLFYNSYVPEKTRLIKDFLRQSTALIRNNYISKYPSVLVAHAGVQGARVGSDFVLVGDADISVDDIPKNMDVCLFGHFHEHQKLCPNAWYVGATHQHNWGDAGGLRGFVHVQIDDARIVTLKHIENTIAPKFVNLTDEDNFKGVRSIDFVRYYTEEDITPEYIDTLKGLALAQVGTVPRIFEVLPVPQEQSKEKVKLDTSKLSSDNMVEEWVNKDSPEDAKELMKLGQEILAEAKGKLL